MKRERFAEGCHQLPKGRSAAKAAKVVIAGKEAHMVLAISRKF
jgi:hypothetical protein